MDMYELKPMTNAGREGTRVMGENPEDKPQSVGGCWELNQTPHLWVQRREDSETLRLGHHATPRLWVQRQEDSETLCHATPPSVGPETVKLSALAAMFATFTPVCSFFLSSLAY